MIQLVKGTRSSASGPDGLDIGIIKHYIKILAPKMSEHAISFLTSPQMEMKIGRTVLLPKTRPPSSNPSQFRPITVFPHMTRFVLKVFELLFRDWLDVQTPPVISMEQAGFCKGRSTLEQVFLLHLATDWNRATSKPLFAAFLDIHKAFDSVDHGALLKVLDDLGIPIRFQRAIASILQGNATIIFGDPIPFEKGTPQGAAPSPLFFILFLEDMVRCLKKHSESTQGARLPWQSVRLLSKLLILLFADDLVIFDSTIEGLQHSLNILVNWGVTNLLSFSAHKSFAMHLAGPVGGRVPLLKLGSDTIEWKDEGIYLGVPIYANCKRRSTQHHYTFKEQQISNTIYAIQRMMMQSYSPLDMDLGLLRMAIMRSLYPQLLYPTAVIDVDYKGFDIKVNRLIRQALQLPIGTHTAYMRTELGIWPIKFAAAATAMRFLWRLHHKYWVSEGFSAMRQSSVDPLYLVTQRTKVLKRYLDYLLFYDLSWELLASTSDSKKWDDLVRDKVTKKIGKWVHDEASTKSIANISRPQQVREMRLSGTTPLPPHYTMDAGLSKVAFHFRSDRLRFLNSKKPRDTKCLWCRQYGQENGRHFLECHSLPEALEGALIRLKGKCTAAGIPDGKLKDFLSLDWSPEPVLTPLLRSVLIFHRSVLRVYRCRFYEGESNSPVGFPIL